MSQLYRQLLDEIAEISVVDAHEHLMVEHERIGDKMDVCDLFCHYNRADLQTAGMTEAELAKLFHTNAHHARRAPDTPPLAARWAILKKYLPAVRHTGYARAVFITLQDLYGVDELTDANVEQVSQAITRTYAEPGLYQRILVERCNIERVVNQAFSNKEGRAFIKDRLETNAGLMVGLLPGSVVLCAAEGNEAFLRTHGHALPPTLDAFHDWLAARCRAWKARRDLVGFKIFPPSRHGQPERGRPDAAATYAHLAQGKKLEASEKQMIALALLHLLADVCAEEQLVCAIHLGIVAGNYGDFRNRDPLACMSFLLEHKDTRFDLYHAAMPWTRALGVIGKQFPNVWLNLCWCAIVSPRMTVDALDEYMDLVPVNKIQAFGGDYGRPVENVYGHLVMAREIVAEVLARRIERGELSESEAPDIARLWLNRNSRVLYGLA